MWQPLRTQFAPVGLGQPELGKNSKSGIWHLTLGPVSENDSGLVFPRPFSMPHFELVQRL